MVKLQKMTPKQFGMK